MKGSARALPIIFVLLIDEVLLVLVVLFVIWKLGIHLPLGVIIALVVAVGVFSLLLYKLITPVLNKKQVTGAEGMIGIEGDVVTPLTPDGVIKVRGELWKAYSTDTGISADEEVIVIGIEGLKLIVRRKDGAEVGEGTRQRDA